MILSSRKNKLIGMIQEGFRNEPYIIVNAFLAGVILIVFLYSGFFSPEKNNYPVVCLHEKITGKPCASCGLSHSFSLIVRGRFSESFRWNIYGFRIFIFFAAQLVMRILFSALFIRNTGIRKQLIIYDIFASVLIFLISFMPFLKFIFSGLVFVTS